MVRNKLKEILARKGKRQSELVEITGLTKGTISNIVNNKFETSISVAFKITDYLDMSIEDIYYDEDIEYAFLHEENPEYLIEKQKIVYKVDVVVVVEDSIDTTEIKERIEKVKSLNAIVRGIIKLE